MLTAGGGGWGDPAERNPAEVRADLERGYVTPEQAQADYGAVASDTADAATNR
jgi:N-methylhydantoinase B